MAIHYPINQTYFIWYNFRVECASFAYKIFKNDNAKYDILPAIIL